MIFFLLPALNESESIVKTLKAIHSQMENIQKKYHIIVCDNGSTDNTAEIAENNNAIVTSQSKKGYGYTLIKGVRHVQDHFKNTPDNEKILIFMDADGQDSEENIAVHLKNLEEVDFSIASRIDNGQSTTADRLTMDKSQAKKQNPSFRNSLKRSDEYPESRIVEQSELKTYKFGSRTFFSATAPKNCGMTGSDAASVFHTLANKLFGFLLWIRTGKKFTDLGPFRALRMNTFLSLDMQELTYGWTAEMQKKVAQQKVSYKEFYSIPKIRVAGDSKVSGSAIWKQIKIGLQIIWVILK